LVGAGGVWSNFGGNLYSCFSDLVYVRPVWGLGFWIWAGFSTRSGLIKGFPVRNTLKSSLVLPMLGGVVDLPLLPP
jgi:hypothetical protein